jgi:hypothetical protein
MLSLMLVKSGESTVCVLGRFDDSGGASGLICLRPEPHLGTLASWSCVHRQPERFGNLQSRLGDSSTNMVLLLHVSPFGICKLALCLLGALTIGRLRWICKATVGHQVRQNMKVAEEVSANIQSSAATIFTSHAAEQTSNEAVQNTWRKVTVFARVESKVEEPVLKRCR